MNVYIIVEWTAKRLRAPTLVTGTLECSQDTVFVVNVDPNGMLHSYDEALQRSSKVEKENCKMEVAYEINVTSICTMFVVLMPI